MIATIGSKPAGVKPGLLEGEIVFDKGVRPKLYSPFDRVLENRAARRDPTVDGFGKCVLYSKLEGWKA
jgi:hypothetical protein